MSLGDHIRVGPQYYGRQSHGAMLAQHGPHGAMLARPATRGEGGVRWWRESLYQSPTVPWQPQNFNAGVMGLGGLGGSSNPFTDEEKAQATNFVKNAINMVDAHIKTGAPHREAVRAAIIVARGELQKARWTDSGWGLIGPAYRPQPELMRKLAEAQNRLLLREGRVSPTAVDPSGKPRIGDESVDLSNVPSDTWDFWKKKIEEEAPDPKKTVLLIAAAGAAVYLAGQYFQGRGRR